MKKYLFIILSVLSAFIYTLFFGIGSHIFDIIVQTVTWSFIILIIPFIIAFKKVDFWRRFNKSSVYTLIIFLVFVVVPRIWVEKQIKEQSNIQEAKNITVINKELKKTWKQFLKDNNIDLTVSNANSFETLQQNNIYSNHYYNIATDFPDSWTVDRGNSEITVLRTINRDSALTISLNVVPNKKEEESKFNKSPLKFINESVKGKNYEVYLKEFMKDSNMDIYDVSLSEQIIRSKNYLKTTFYYNEISDNYKVKFKVCNYQTMVFNLTYTFIYTSPEIFYNQNIIDEVIFRTNYGKGLNK